MQKVIYYFFFFCVIAFCGFFAFFIFFYFFDYDYLISQLLPFTSSNQQVNKLKNQILTPYKFQILRLLLFLILSILIAFLYFFYKFKQKVLKIIDLRIDFYNETKLLFKSLCKKLTRTQILFLFIFLLFLLFVRSYWALQYPLTYDEIYIWEEFVSRGLLVSMSYYPIHGNHVFQTILVNIISFLEPIWALRLPSILSSFLLDFILWSYLYHKSKNFFSSIIIVILFNFLYVNWIHSFLGRGYQLELLLALIIMIFYEKRWIEKFFYELVFLQILLIYTLPSGIFFLVSLWWFEWFSFKNKYLIYNILFTISFAFILYLPILFFLNIEVLFSGAYYQKIDFYEKMKFFNQIWQFPDIWNFSYIMGLFFSILTLIYLKIQWKSWHKIFFFYLLIAILLGIITSFPAKAFMPLSFILPLILIEMKLPKILFIVLILVEIFLYMSNIQEFEFQFQKHFDANAFAKKVYQKYPQSPALKIQLRPNDLSDLYFLNLKHVYHNHQQRIELNENSKFILENINIARKGKVMLQDNNMKLVWID